MSDMTPIWTNYRFGHFSFELEPIIVIYMYMTSSRVDESDFE